MADDGAAAVVADGYWCATLGGLRAKWFNYIIFISFYTRSEWIASALCCTNFQGNYSP